jgi:hypothetical protein
LIAQGDERIIFCHHPSDEQNNCDEERVKDEHSMSPFVTWEEENRPNRFEYQTGSVARLQWVLISLIFIEKC